MKLEKLKTWISNLKTSHIIIAFIFLGVFAVLMERDKPEQNITVVDPTSVDTYIPEGMTLIPIEIQNIEALKNILGDFGVVDLYLPSFDTQKAPKKIASGIKIMRAPLNPDVFAVLVRSENAAHVAQHPGAFFVTVLNPKTQNTKFNQESKKHKTQIVTEI